MFELLFLIVIDKYLLIDSLYHFISNIIKFFVKITCNSGDRNRGRDSFHCKSNYSNSLKKSELGEYVILGNYKVVK